MTPATGTALLLLVAFVLPGFVTLMFSERTHTIRGDDAPFDRLMQALYYSALTYGVLAVAAFLIGYERRDVESLFRREQDLRKLLVLAVIAIIVLPFGISQLGRLWRRSRRLRPRVLNAARVSLVHSTPSGWEHFFESGEAALVRVTLTDGRVVGGYYGDNSFSGYSQQAGDLFLEQRWELDDDAWFVKPAAANIGLWLPRSSIASIELYQAPQHARSEP